MTTLIGIATRAAKVEAAKYGRPMLLVLTRDDWGKVTVEYVAEGMEGILYRVQLQHGLAVICGKVMPNGNVTVWEAELAPRMDRAARADAEVHTEYDAGQRQAMACLTDD